MGETRVNLKHLLEDIRDTYPFPIEEVILSELVANALDSGASEIHFSANPKLKSLTVVDNGSGMNASQLNRYHDIAATTKERGKGIGFAGIGAKLALLIADEVITETKTNRVHSATLWRLEDDQRAPWELIKPAGLIDDAHGTAVTLALGAASHLTDSRYIERVLQTHFVPLLEEAFSPIIRTVYPDGVQFSINGRAVQPLKLTGICDTRTFVIRRGSNLKATALGSISRSETELPEWQYGIAISAYGKVIRRGWEWLGMMPEHPNQLTGMVEVPALAEILTTNKADFLKDGASLKKYYRHRKAIQEAIEPILRELGESTAARERSVQDVRPLERQVEQVLNQMIDDYPEMAPLVGRRPVRAADIVFALVSDGWVLPEPLLQSEVDIAPIEVAPPTHSVEPASAENGEGDTQPQQRKPPAHGLMIGFEDAADRNELGWLVENTIWINRAHPAYQKAASSGNENYHTVVSVLWVLLGHLDDRHSPQQFISQFLSAWGAQAT